MIWERTRTCSLFGFPGRNVAWDQRNEFMNKDVKDTDPQDPSRIDAYICMLNGISGVEDHLREALGEERTDPSEYTPVKPHHVQAIVDALKRTLGANMDELFGAGRKKTSPFGGGPRPWTQVRNAGKLPNGASAADMRAEVVEWVTAQLERAPFPT